MLKPVNFFEICFSLSAGGCADTIFCFYVYMPIFTDFNKILFRPRPTNSCRFTRTLDLEEPELAAILCVLAAESAIVIGWNRCKVEL